MARMFRGSDWILSSRFVILAALLAAAFGTGSYARAQVPVPVMVNFFDIGHTIKTGNGITRIPGSGNYAIVEYNPDRVYIVDKLGNVLSQFDTPAGSLAPSGITFIPPNRFAICDSSAREVFIVDLDGNPVGQFDTATFGSNAPQGIAYNPDTGHLAIVDNSQDEVYIVTVAGVLQDQFDISSAGSSNPYGITYVPATGNYAIVDTTAQAVFIVNSSGQKQTQFDTGFVSSAPRGIVYNPDENTYEVIDVTSDEVFALNNEGDFFDQFSTAVFGASAPSGITYNPDTGNYAISDDGARGIFFVSPSGDVVGQCDVSAFSTNPSGIAYLQAPGNYAGNYALSDRSGREIFIVSPTCALVAQFDTDTFGMSSAYPSGITYWPGTDELVLTDNYIDAAFFFDTDLPGKITAQFSTGMFQSNNPEDIAYIDVSGSFAVVDSTADDVFVVNSNGVIKARFATAPWSTLPRGIAYNSKDKVFAIADSNADAVYLLNLPALTAGVPQETCKGDFDGDGDVDGDDLTVFAGEFGLMGCP